MNLISDDSRIFSTIFSQSYMAYGKHKGKYSRVIKDQFHELTTHEITLQK